MGIDPSAGINVTAIQWIIGITAGVAFALAAFRVLFERKRMSYGEMGNDAAQKALGTAYLVMGLSVGVVISLFFNGFNFLITRG